MRSEAIPPALAAEGGLMLDALVGDLLAHGSGLTLVVLRDDRLPLPFQGDGIHTIMIGDRANFAEVWQDGIHHSDAVWPIAPETGGILERLCLDVETAGKILLTCPSAAVRLAASKLKTLRRLAEFGLPVVPSEPLDARKLPEGTAFVVKPDDGVGCEGTVIVRNTARLAELALTENLMVQALVEGEPMSLAVLFANGRARLLSCNRQRIERSGLGFALRGCTVNALHDRDGRWQALADEVARAVPELWGYAGIDLILAEQGPAILEINPRLTTSYAGLRPATGINPASLVLNLLITGQLPAAPIPAGRAVDIYWGDPDGE